MENEVNYMNIHTGSVDTYENWMAEGHDPEENKGLIEVEFDNNGDWIEV